MYAFHRAQTLGFGLYPEYASMKLRSSCLLLHLPADQCEVVESCPLGMHHSSWRKQCRSSTFHWTLGLTQDLIISQDNRTLLWILFLRGNLPPPVKPYSDLHLMLFTFGVLVLTVDLCSIYGTLSPDGSKPCLHVSKRVHLGFSSRIPQVALSTRCLDTCLSSLLCLVH